MRSARRASPPRRPDPPAIPRSTLQHPTCGRLQKPPVGSQSFSHSFAVVYWHTFRGTGSDPFGAGTMQRPWDDGSNSVSNAQKRARVAFEFISKLGAPFYCFHDRDVAPEGKNLAETNKNFDAVAKVLKEEQKRTGIKLLWGTANLFSNPRFVHGASTSCNADVF